MSVCQLSLLFGSFKRIKLIKPCLFLYILRNILPLYDIEGRRDSMHAFAWSQLVTLIIVICIFNVLLLNNIMEKHFYKTAFIIMIAVGIGAIKAIKREHIWNEHHSAGIITIVTGNILILLFMYIQKRVHKEVFLEMKQKVSLQDEFKTIFN